MKKYALYAVCCLLISQASPFAQEAAPVKPFSFNIGATATDGNSDSMQTNASLTLEGEKQSLGSFRTGAEINYGETEVDGEDSKNTDNGKLFANVRKTLSGLSFLYIDGTLLYDDIAYVDYRLTIGPGYGCYLLKNEQTALSVETGLSYVWEKVAEVKDDYAALRLAERFDTNISPTAKLWQSAEYLPQIDDFQNYLINAEIGTEAALNANWHVRIVLQDKYDSEPAPEFEKNDLALIAGFGISY